MPPITVTASGVYKLLSSINTAKSVGPDGISPCILNEAANELTPVLTYLFSKSLSTGEVPDDWRLANIFPLHKKGPKDSTENYRPISLTAVTSKLLQHIISSSICRFLDDHNIITPRQHGFRSGHSCVSQLILAIEDWARASDSGLHTDMAIFD